MGFPEHRISTRAVIKFPGGGGYGLAVKFRLGETAAETTAGVVIEICINTWVVGDRKWI
jgi:hypothetical protein